MMAMPQQPGVMTSMGMQPQAMGMAAAPMGIPPASMGMPVASMGMQMPGAVPGVPAAVPQMAAPTVAGAISSGGSTPVHMDWAVPQPTRAKYSALFQNTDRARTGFLAGVQARNILMQSQLPQNILAQVW